MNQDALHQVIDYNCVTGEFRWKKNRGSRARAGCIAGSINGGGYRVIRISGTDYLAHRLAWLYVHGYQPRMLDHVDHDPANNAITNLRESCKSTNGANRGPQRNNTSGFKGVKKRYRRWIAQIHIGGRNTYLGSFARIEDAAAAYAKAAEKEFGDFARTV